MSTILTQEERASLGSDSDFNNNLIYYREIFGGQLLLLTKQFIPHCFSVL